LPFKFSNCELFIYICRYHFSSTGMWSIYGYDISEVVVPIMNSLTEGCCWQGSYWTKGVNIPHFPYWWLPIRFLIRVAPRVPLVEQELTHFLFFCEVFVAQYLVFCVVFWRSSSELFLFGHCFVWTSSIYGLWLSLWYLLPVLELVVSEVLCRGTYNCHYCNVQ
jgi:hypothetical protein